ncbi:FecR family protein [Runella sp. MFBS21]|uniref:FecR family protein n=1 Tax=Runella sp. MFBS21 TaxID=3034018 RepID=UPI0023F7015F|nr:FecR family protein [Runella sp. MFBS21]MDF7816445.1 FecR family protein [Runella sp. MFBS21]
MKYQDYQVQDFLNDDLFVKWVLFAEQDEFWIDFLEQNPSKHTIITEAKEIVRSLYKAEHTTSPDLNKKEVWRTIESTLFDTENEAKKIDFWQSAGLKWAASIAVLLVIGWLLFRPKSEIKISYHDLVQEAENKSTLAEHINTSDTPLKVRLPDSSFVTLQKNSRISYPTPFSPHQREVFLSGEAFFEVTKNKKKPFYVYANEVITKVLGTSFVIKAFDNDNKVFVNVHTGRVSVFKQNKIDIADPETQGLILLPNQRVVISRITPTISKGLVAEPRPVVPLEKYPRTYFDEVPVTNVFRELEKLYEVKILYNEEELSDCIITTTLRNESLYDKLDLICKTIGATYKEVDAQIVISSNGCH